MSAAPGEVTAGRILRACLFRCFWGRWASLGLTRMQIPLRLELVVAFVNDVITPLHSKHPRIPG